MLLDAIRNSTINFVKDNAPLCVTNSFAVFIVIAHDVYALSFTPMSDRKMRGRLVVFKLENRLVSKYGRLHSPSFAIG